MLVLKADPPVNLDGKGGRLGSLSSDLDAFIM